MSVDDPKRSLSQAPKNQSRSLSDLTHDIALAILCAPQGQRGARARETIPAVRGRASSSSSVDRKYVPFTGHALEGMAATVAEAQPGARHQVLYGARHQHLARTG